MGPRLAAGLTCLGVAGLMSMTFFKSDWSNVGSVPTVLAILGFAGVAGVGLLATGLRRMVDARQWGGIEIETRVGELALGETTTLRLVLAPGRELALREIGLEAWVEERAEGAEGLGEALVRTLLAEKLEPVGRPVGAAEERIVELPVVVPSGAPGTLALERHSWSLRVRARLGLPGGADRIENFSIPVRPVRKGSVPPAPPGEEGALVWERAGARLVLELPGGAPGPLAVESGARLEVGIRIEPSQAATFVLRPRVVREVGGAMPESRVVGESGPLDPGPLVPGTPARVALGLSLPAGLPPSYAGGAFAIEYRLELGVEPEGALGPDEPALPLVVLAPEARD